VGLTSNLAEACLVGADLYRAYGFVGAFMPNAWLLRANLREADLRGATLIGITTGDKYSHGWTPEIGKKMLDEGDGARDEFYKFIANFQDADLSGADLTNAGLEGADLRGAKLTKAKIVGTNISRADFRDAEITWDELKEARCSGNQDPPLLSGPLKSVVLKQLQESPESGLAASGCRFNNR
jgi:uncharacterized protein YjbI with pentapeptide repeats